MTQYKILRRHKSTGKTKMLSESKKWMPLLSTEQPPAKMNETEAIELTTKLAATRDGDKYYFLRALISQL